MRTLLRARAQRNVHALTRLRVAVILTRIAPCCLRPRSQPPPQTLRGLREAMEREYTPSEEELAERWAALEAVEDAGGDVDAAAYFFAYRRMGGRRDEAAFAALLERFFQYTWALFAEREPSARVTRASGEDVVLTSRKAAADAFTEDCLGGDAQEWSRIFVAVDSSIGYTQ
jgi:hypothetical protein